MLIPIFLPTGGGGGAMPWQFIVWIVSIFAFVLVIIGMLALSMVSERANNFFVYPGNTGELVIGCGLIWNFFGLPLLLLIIAGIQRLLRRFIYVDNVQRPKIRERCSKCGATWDGDGWTLYCPVCGRDQGNR